MIEIELTEPKKSRCECCRGTTTSLTRFVYKDGNAHAIYYATFSDNHPDSVVEGIVSLGGWTSEEVPPDRVAFCFRLWHDDENFNVGITDSDSSPWKDAKIVGRILNRDESLNHPWIDEVFHITDHIVVDDFEIVNFFKSDSLAIN